jgi:hypothetical protein
VQQDEVLRQLIDKQRKDREMGDGNFSIQAENKLQSLWLHSAFCDFEPPWLSAFIEELRTCPEASGLSSSLEEALTDDRATNWGDHSTHRPLFTTWVNLSLSAWLDPRNIAMDVDEQPRRSKRNLASKTVGSAAFLSSMPLRPRYFALAKSWISEVYNAVRNAEIAMLLHNRELRISEANLAGPYFAHEIQTVVDQALATAQRDFANNSEEAVERRRFVLYSIRTLCILAYSFTKVISVDGRMTEEAEETLLRPLQDLRNDKVLISDVINIAEKIYQSVRSKQGGTITFPETPSSKIFANELQHGACFLLTVELLRNYCQSKASGPPATFRAWLENDENILNIELEGSTGAGRNPRSMSLARLDQFLRVLGFGKTTFDWDNKAHTFKATVQVDLGIKSLHRHQFS